MYNRPINYQVQWASAGTPLVPTFEKIRNGWTGNEKPLVQHMNWILNRIDGAIGYFLQGAADWGPEVDYPAGKLISYEGELYRSLQTVPASAKIEITNTEYWEPAYFSTGSGESLAEEIRKIKEEDGYLSKYLKISDPVTPARMKAGSYQADRGVASENSFNMGYSFSGYNTTGMFLNNTTLTFTVGSNTRLTIPASVPTLEDKSTNVATTDWVQRLIESKIGEIDITANRLPVGSIYISINNQNPNATLGYGTWVRFAQGQVIVGVSDEVSDPSWTKQVLNEFGEYNVQLTTDQMPAHYHGYPSDVNLKKHFELELYNDVKSRYDAYSTANNEYLSGNYRTTTEGNSQAHNNTQPSITAFIWRRTA